MTGVQTCALPIYYRVLDEENDGFIDGGRDYTRCNPNVGKLVKLKVVKDHLEVVE